MDFLLDMDDDDVVAMCDDVGMKNVHKKKFLKAIRKLKAPTAAEPRKGEKAAANDFAAAPAPASTPALAATLLDVGGDNDTDEGAYGGEEEMLFDVGSSSGGGDGDSNKGRVEAELAVVPLPTWYWHSATYVCFYLWVHV